jgi:capsular polysaccharide biosynthesis protein
MRDVADPVSSSAAVTSIPLTGVGRIRVPIRSLFLLGLCAAIGTLAAYGISTRQPRLYGARIDILVNTRGYSTDVEIARLLETQKFVLGSERVLRPAGEKLGTSYRQLAGAVRVGIVGETEVLRVVVALPDRGRAVEAAQQVAASYILNGWIPPGVSVSDEGLQALIVSLADVRARLGQLGSDEASALEHQRLEITEGGLVKRIEVEQERLSSLESERATPPDARIVAPAIALDAPVQPRPVRAGLAGFVIGSLVGAGAVLAQRVLARRFVLLWS